MENLSIQNTRAEGVVLEHPVCPLCGASDFTHALESQDDWIPQGASRGLRFSVLRCKGCLGCYTSPRYPEPLKHLAFLGTYPFYERARRNLAPPSLGELGVFDRRASLILQAHPARGRILDLGMGDGAFLAGMQQRGWAVSGMDIEPSVVRYAQVQLGIQDCVVGDIEQDALPQGPFDAITLWGMLQLAYHPEALLVRLRRMMTPGGILGIGLSNFASVGAAVFGRHWWGLGLPRHLVHYDPVSIQRLLERSGYGVVGTFFETPDWMVNGSMQAAVRLPGLAGRGARLMARKVLGQLGRTRWGDTITLIAKPVDT